MNKFAKKYREWIIFFGYTCIGLSIVGMVFISINIIMMVWNLIVAPVSQPAVALVLPFTNVPGVGYLSFFHWIIAIFVLAIVHEFAHGIVARAHGLQIKSSGFAFFALIAPIIPAAFVEPDEKQLFKKSDVVQYSVFAAGPIINIVLAFLIFLIITPGLTAIENRITDPVGLSFDLLNESYPASQAGMQPGIINQVNGEDVISYESFTDAIYGIEPNEEITISTDTGNYTLITAISPDNPKKGFIGIMPTANERTMKSQFEWLKHPFFWTKDLFRWLFLLNFFIGLFNLLPLGIVDGGRILKTFLSKVIKDQKKAGKIWGFISLFFLLLLLFGLMTTYLGNPFAFLR
ncbi:MAG: M50 family metallopeptidase [Candidatus Woesearchaeota archaeon]